MSEESKYYIPNIEEFHVDFEYEENEETVILGGWKKKRFNFYDLEIIKDEIRENILRIKYLDREDIEGLGWIWEEQDLFNSKDWKWTLLMLGNNTIEISDEGECMFYGTIKNKSELNKLMKQLGI